MKKPVGVYALASRWDGESLILTHGTEGGKVFVLEYGPLHIQGLRVMLAPAEEPQEVPVSG